MGIVERKEREKTHRKEEIINAAERVFFEKGLALATMDDIAEKAELSKGTLYLYYKSKEDLYMAVICRGHQILLKMFEESTSTGEPTVKLFQNISESYYDFYRRHRNYFRMFSFSENTQLHSQVSQEMQSACANSGQCIGQVLMGLIEKGKADGTFRPEVDPQEMALILWANSRGIMELIDHLSGKEACSVGTFCDLNLQRMYRKSGAMLQYAILTDQARRSFKLEL